MVISFDRICKVDYDNIIVVILVVYSLFNIYFIYNEDFKTNI